MCMYKCVYISRNSKVCVYLWMFGCVCIVCAMYVCMFYVGKYLVRCMHVCVCVCMICVGTLHYKHTGSVQAFFSQNLQAFNT